MFNQEVIDLEILVIIIVIYLFLLATVSKLGTYKKCGGMKAFLVSLFLTPLIGIVYVAISPVKSVLKIIHYRCHHCNLEYTSKQKYCPACMKEGNKHRLEKISMRAY